MTRPDFAALGIDRRDAAALEAAAASSIPGSLVLVVSPDPGLAFTAAQVAARAGLAEDSSALDLHVAVPAEDRWTLAEVDDRILRPARLKAFERTHIIVADADQMGQAAFDHVLKTVEEPTSGALFWFAVGNLERIPVTLRGRAGAVLHARPAPAQERVALLEAAGADPGVATRIAQLAGDDVRLALAVAADPDLLVHLTRYATSPLASTVPTRDADEDLDAIVHLARALPAPTEPGDTPTPRKKARVRPATSKPRAASTRPRWDTLPPAARPAARRMVRRLLDRWSTETRCALHGAGTAAALRTLDTQLRAIAKAQSELSVNTPAVTVLPAVRARANTA